MIPGLVSVVIPSRNEKYLQKTVEDLLVKAKNEIEVIVVLDGYWPRFEEYSKDDRVKYIHFDKSKGMRHAINSAVRLSKGEYIFKVDAHCMFDKWFDYKLKRSCDDNWVVVPRRMRLDPEEWTLCETEKPFVDYMYLAYPEDPTVWGGKSLQGKEWRQKNINTEEYKRIDNLMTFQGSAWFMKRSYFDFLELMDEENYGQFAKEAQEIGMKAWLSGGRVVVNKNTWYAHWHKPKEHGRGYALDGKEFNKGSEYTLKWYTEPKVWHKQTNSFQEFMQWFWPVPTWPEDWLEKQNETH